MDSCWRCGQKLISTAKFCASCGAPIAAPSAAPGAAPPPAPTEHPSDRPDPLAATAPANAEQLAALRRGELPKKPAPIAIPGAGGAGVPSGAVSANAGASSGAGSAQGAAASTAKPGKRGGTVPLQAVPHLAPPAAGARRVSLTVDDTNNPPAPAQVAPRAPPQELPTLRSGEGGPAQSAAPVSPMARSAYQPGLSAAGAPPPGPAASAQPAPPGQRPSYGGAPPGASPNPSHPFGPGGSAPGAPYGAPSGPMTPPAPPAIGARVLVQWSDGRRYGGTVQQCAAGQCLVLFPDGQQRWVDLRRVSSA